MSLESMIPNINERQQDQEQDRKEGGYADQYYDENETREGQEKYDLATGKAIKNDSDVEGSHGLLVDEQGVLQNFKKELKKDEATAWLLANNFDEFGNKILPDEKSKKKAA